MLIDQEKACGEEKSERRRRRRRRRRRGKATECEHTLRSEKRAWSTKGHLTNSFFIRSDRAHEEKGPEPFFTHICKNYFGEQGETNYGQGSCGMAVASQKWRLSLLSPDGGDFPFSLCVELLRPAI